MQGDRYSRLIGWLKVVLPLMALGILSTLFLLSRVIDPETVIPFADKEIQDRLRDQQVTGPVYYAVTADGDEISFAAEKLTTLPSTTGTNAALDVRVVMDLTSGTSIVLTARDGLLDIAADTADLRGDVLIETSGGYRVESDRLITQMTALDVLSPGPVNALGPIGTLDAGQMTLQSGEGDANAQLLFTKGVKLVYTPQKNQE